MVAYFTCNCNTGRDSYRTIRFCCIYKFFKWPKLPFRPLIFAGLYNFIQLFHDPAFINSLRVSFQFVGVAVFFELIGGFVLALALANIKRFRGILCSYFLVPSMLPMVAVGVIWLLLFSMYYGPINYVLSILFDMKPVPWTASAKWSLWSIIIADVWQWTPFMMIIMLAGLVSIPQDPLEAAIVDGASSLQKLFYVTLPLIRPVILVALIIRTVDAFKVFGLPLVMTGGGPGNTTEVLSLYVYRVGFKFWNLSYAAAISLFFLVIIIAIITAYIRVITAEGGGR